MESSDKKKTVAALLEELNTSQLQLKHRLQRREGAWNNEKKSLLVDSLLRNYRVDPTDVVVDDGVRYVIDGVQRISTLLRYSQDAFALSSKLKPVKIPAGVVDKKMTYQEYEIAGKKYSKLDSEVQKYLLGRELTIFEYTDYEDEDVRELFKRKNSGKALNNRQLRTIIETDEFIDVINDLVEQPFMYKICTEAQRISDADKEFIRQALMLINTDDSHDYTSFRTNHVDAFILIYQENIDMTQIDNLKKTLTCFDEAFPGKVTINPSTIPMVLYAGYTVVRRKKSFSKFITALKEFLDGYEANEEYKAFCSKGTSGSDMVKGRFEYFKNMIKGI